MHVDIIAGHLHSFEALVRCLSFVTKQLDLFLVCTRIPVEAMQAAIFIILEAVEEALVSARDRVEICVVFLGAQVRLQHLVVPDSVSFFDKPDEPLRVPRVVPPLAIPVAFDGIRDSEAFVTWSDPVRAGVVIVLESFNDRRVVAFDQLIQFDHCVSERRAEDENRQKASKHSVHFSFALDVEAGDFDTEIVQVLEHVLDVPSRLSLPVATSSA